MALAAKEITVFESKQEDIQKLERLLERGSTTLISGSGEKIRLPKAVQEVLKRAVEIMAKGRAVTLIPDSQAITTQRAAHILGMSRPFFIKLLETGAMAHHRVGNQRRVYLRDVLQFVRKREHERQAALNRLSRQAFESGLYEKNRFPEGGQDE
ncbi:MAG TPA: excisionase family DNA-binding protein [Candidatus Angelobacter sp.]